MRLVTPERGAFADQITRPEATFVAVPAGADARPNYGPSVVLSAPEAQVAPAPVSMRAARSGHAAPQPAA